MPITHNEVNESIDNDEVSVRAIQEAELSEWLTLTATIADDLTPFICKLLFKQHLYSVEDIACMIVDNPNILSPKIGPANIKKIIRALVDGNLIPATCHAARCLLPVSDDDGDVAAKTSKPRSRKSKQSRSSSDGAADASETPQTTFSRASIFLQGRKGPGRPLPRPNPAIVDECIARIASLPPPGSILPSKYTHRKNLDTFDISYNSASEAPSSMLALSSMAHGHMNEEDGSDEDASVVFNSQGVTHHRDLMPVDMEVEAGGEHEYAEGEHIHVLSRLYLTGYYQAKRAREEAAGVSNKQYAGRCQRICRVCKKVTSFYCVGCTAEQKKFVVCCDDKRRDCFDKLHGYAINDSELP